MTRRIQRNKSCIPWWSQLFFSSHFHPEPCSLDYAVSGPLVVMEGAFSASSMSDPTHTPHNVRLHPVSENTPPSCWRVGDTFDPSSPPWVEVNLGTIKVSMIQQKTWFFTGMVNKGVVPWPHYGTVSLMFKTLAVRDQIQWVSWSKRLWRTE